MTDEIAYRITGDGGGIIAVFQDLHKWAKTTVDDLLETAKGAKKYGDDHSKALKESTAAMDRLHAASEKWKRSIESPADRHAANLKELRVLYNMGKVSLDQYTAAVEKSRNEMQAALGPSNKMVATTEALRVGWLAAAAAATEFAQATRQDQKDSDAAADSLDDLKRKFRVQSGLEGPALEEAYGNIEKATLENKVTPEQGFAAAIQLTSSGLAPSEAAGGGLDQFLKLMSATNQGGDKFDPKEIAEAIAAVLESQQLPKTAESIREVGMAVQRLFKGTNFQLPDLAAVAKEGAAFKQAIDLPQQFAAMSVLRDLGMSSETGSVALRNVLGRLQGASAKKEGRKALESMGLATGDVDFISPEGGPREDLYTVLGRLEEGLGRLKAEDRVPALTHLFGQAGAADALKLIGGREKLLNAIAIQSDAAGYEKDIAIGQSGRGPAMTQLKSQEFFKDASEAELDAIWKQALENQFDAEGMWPARKKAALDGITMPLIGQIPTGYELMRSIGFSPRTSAYWSTDLGSSTFEGAERRVNEAMGNPDGGNQPLIAAMDRLGQKLDRNSDITAKLNEQPMPATRVPSAAGGGKPDSSPPGRRPSADRQSSSQVP